MDKRSPKMQGQRVFSHVLTCPLQHTWLWLPQCSSNITEVRPQVSLRMPAARTHTNMVSKDSHQRIIQWKSYLILCIHYLMNVYIRICVYYIKVVCGHCNVLSNGHELPCLLYSMCLMRIHIYSELKWVCVAELTNRKSLQSTPCEDSQEVEPNGDQFEPIQQPADID